MKKKILAALISTVLLVPQSTFANTMTTTFTEQNSILTVETVNSVIPDIKITGSTVQNMIGGKFIDNNGDNCADMLISYGIAEFTLSGNIQTFLPNSQYGSITSRFHGEPTETYLAIAEVKASSSNVVLYLNDGTTQYGSQHSGSGQFETLAIKMSFAENKTASLVKLQDNRPSNWTETQVKEGITVVKLTSDEVNLPTEELVKKYSPIIGIESTSDIELTISNENIINSDEFAAKTIRQASDTYAKVESLDGRRVLAFRGSSNYTNRSLGLEIFKPNQQYTFSVEAKNDGKNGGVFVITHTDNSIKYMTYGGATTAEFVKYEVNSIAGKTVKDIYISYNSSGVNYYDLDSLSVMETDSIGGVNTVHNETRTLFPIELTSLAEVYDELIVNGGVAKKVEKNKKIDLSGDLDWEWSYEWSGAGNKRVRLFLSDSKSVNDFATENAVVSKYNEQPLRKADTNDMIANTHNLWSKYLYVNIDNNDSGWGEGYIPSNDEVKAYFYGWKMSTTSRTWTPIGDMDNSRKVDNVPLYPSPSITEGKITYYKALYQLEVPQIVDVIYEGDTPVLLSGKNHVFFETGIDYNDLSSRAQHFKFATILSIVDDGSKIVDSLLKMTDENRNVISSMNLKINNLESILNEVLSKIEGTGKSGTITFEYDNNGNLENIIAK